MMLALNAAYRGVQGQHHRNQPRRRPAIRLRKLHRQRTFARQRPDAPRTPAGRRQPLHARMAGRRRASAQRLRIAGPAATGHRILRRTPLRGVSRRTADRKKPRRSRRRADKSLKNLRHSLFSLSSETDNDPLKLKTMKKQILFLLLLGGTTSASAQGGGISTVSRPAAPRCA